MILINKNILHLFFSLLIIISLLVVIHIPRYLLHLYPHKIIIPTIIMLHLAFSTIILVRIIIEVIVVVFDLVIGVEIWVSDVVGLPDLLLLVVGRVGSGTGDFLLLLVGEGLLV